MPKSVSRNTSFSSAMNTPVTVLFPWILGGIVCFAILVSEQAGWLGWHRFARVTIDPGIRFQTGVQRAWQQIHRQWQFWENGSTRLAQLEHDFARLQIDRAELDRLRTENQQLLASANVPSSEKMTVKWYGSKQNWFIGVGCDQGIQPGSPVFFQQSLVGQVSEVSPTYSRVQSWDDPDWRLAVKVGTQSAQGVFHSERGLWEVSEVRRGSAVEAKNSVVTAGQGILPADIAVATVQSLTEETGFGTITLQVEPLFRLEELRWVEVSPTGGTCSG